MRKAIKENIANLLPHIPKDIIFNILLHLPAKSLFRFRSICNSWPDLFFDPQFHDACNHRCIIISSFLDLSLLIKSIDFETSDAQRVDKLESPGTWLKNQRVQFLGSSNGLLLCTVNGKHLCLNPTTREWMGLSPIGYETDDLVFYGFGYDFSTDDYKVVRSICYADYTCCERNDNFDLDISPGKRRDEVFIYTRKTNSWNWISNFPHKDIIQYGGETEKWTIWVRLRDGQYG
ncbi:unnamed protein product [Ilex paraguariensis]|uniref:F-box domain-containing protein n=1 Tax=Ilex paraguariensis TaxID=185542 RepID=A0ABC8U3Z7_9AQUA